MGPYVFAAQDGYFAKYGLTVTTPQSDEGTLKDSFVGGNVKIDGLSGADPFQVYTAGYPLQVIGCTISRIPFHVYAKTSVASAKDLVGKTLGTTSLGSGHMIALESWLKQNGVNPSQVKFVPLGSVPNILAALESGNIDAGGLSYPFYATASAIPSLHALGLAYLGEGPIVVNSTWAKHNKNTILAYLKGQIEGSWAYYTNEQKALPVLASFLGLSLSNSVQASKVQAGFTTYAPPKSEPIASCDSSFLSFYKPFLTPDEQAAVLHNKHGLFLNNSYVAELKAEGFYTRLAQKYGALAGFRP